MEQPKIKNNISFEQDISNINSKSKYNKSFTSGYTNLDNKTKSILKNRKSSIIKGVLEKNTISEFVENTNLKKVSSDTRFLEDKNSSNDILDNLDGKKIVKPLKNNSFSFSDRSINNNDSN